MGGDGGNTLKTDFNAEKGRSGTVNPAFANYSLTIAQLLQVKKVLRLCLLWAPIRIHLAVMRRPGTTPRPGTEKRTGSPMLAKRFIVAAFAALAVGMSSLAFSGPNDLFTDLPPVQSALANS
jgi:hypothetical protein